MGKNIILTYVTIQNPENYMAYIPVIRPFSGDSISDIKENLQNQRHVISFDNVYIKPVDWFANRHYN